MEVFGSLRLFTVYGRYNLVPRAFPHPVFEGEALGTRLYCNADRPLDVSLPADVLWGSFVTHSVLPHGVAFLDGPRWVATGTPAVFLLPSIRKIQNGQ